MRDFSRHSGFDTVIQGTDKAPLLPVKSRTSRFFGEDLSGQIAITLYAAFAWLILMIMLAAVDIHRMY